MTGKEVRHLNIKNKIVFGLYSQPSLKKKILARATLKDDHNRNARRNILCPKPQQIKKYFTKKWTLRRLIFLAIIILLLKNIF